MKIGVITNATISGTEAALRTLRAAAATRDIHVLDASTDARPDFYVVLGGDGSVLRAIHTVPCDGVPLVNINIGSLGYLTCAGLEELDSVLDTLVMGRHTISIRTMLHAACTDAAGVPLAPPVHALNDLVVLRGDSGRIIGISLNVDGADVTEFLCDGLIVASPTGSTAYSLAAGGPIILPDARVLTISVICPHTLTSRPLVLPETAAITLTVSRGHSPVSFSFDGQISATLKTGDRITISRSDRTAHLVMMPGHNPFDTLSRKLGWSGALLK